MISSWKVVENRSSESELYYKIRVTLIDESLLQASEYKDIKERSYSFHWQDKNGQLIIRWDNAPHFKHLATYPHHKHQLDRVEENIEMTLEQVLAEIEEILK